jgi:hypothetical protein
MEVDPLSHVAARFSHALTMVAGLIPHTDDPSLDRLVSIACLEDWFTNYRLVIEFLLMKPPANCASAKTFIPNWTPASDKKKQLIADYGWASEDVAHIGHPTSIDRGGIDPPVLRAKAALLFEVAGDFVEALKREGNDHALMVSVALAQAKGALDRS